MESFEMRIGFSTGALARGKYWQAIDVLRAHHISIVELSALRVSELEPLVADLDRLPLGDFEFVSFHAPSNFDRELEETVVRHLRRVAQRGIPIVVHPDVIFTDQHWSSISKSLFIENMDKRKSIGRTVEEMGELFKRFPDAGFCFDIGHARQVDPTMVEAHRLLVEFGSRLKQVHMSEVNTASHHDPISVYAIQAFQCVASLIPNGTPVILETLIDQGQSLVETEIEKAEQALTAPAHHLALAG
jgi:hypothetical protein